MKNLKRNILPILISTILWAFLPISKEAEAQIMRDVMINTGAGMLTGASLGGATMALSNDGDLTPLRIGVGAGTLFGFGVGMYDAFTIPRDDDYYIDATFTSGHQRGTIILLDTFYGSATGALLGTAIALISEDQVIDGLRVGSGIGAYIGFGFGLLDAFVLGEAVPFDAFYDDYVQKSPDTSGLISFNTGEHATVGLLQPKLIYYPEFSGGVPELKAGFALEAASWKLNF